MARELSARRACLCADACVPPIARPHQKKDCAGYRHSSYRDTAVRMPTRMHALLSWRALARHRLEACERQSSCWHDVHGRPCMRVSRGVINATSASRCHPHSNSKRVGMPSKVSMRATRGEVNDATLGAMRRSSFGHTGTPMRACISLRVTRPTRGLRRHPHSGPTHWPTYVQVREACIRRRKQIDAKLEAPPAVGLSARLRHA